MVEDQIKKYWDSQAVKHKDTHNASWDDHYMINLEIDNIAQHIKKGDKVLDVGCANGHSSFRQLEQEPALIVGVDYSEPMISAAVNKKKRLKLADTIDFKVGNILDLPFPDHCFDVVYTTRVIINQPTWALQKQAIDECLRVTANKGTTIFSEAFYEPLVLLNAMRGLKQLPPLVEPDFNLYLKKAVVEEYFASIGRRFKNVDFSSVYYLGSRFLRELITNPKDYPGYSNPVNEIFYELEKKFSGGGFGIQQAYIINK